MIGNGELYMQHGNVDIPVVYHIRVQNSSRLSAVAGTLTTLAGYFLPKKYKISCLDRSTEISCCKLKETFYIRQ